MGRSCRQCRKALSGLRCGRRPMARKYHVGETDAIVRRFRRYQLLLTDAEVPASRKTHLAAVITEDFAALDEYLSRGEPLPGEWVAARLRRLKAVEQKRRREGVKVAGQIATAPTQQEPSEKEGT